MPTPDSIAARIDRDGEDVLLRRPGAPPVQATVRAFVRGFKPDELVGGIQQGDRELRVAPGPLAALGWPGPPQRGDDVVIRGRTTKVQACETRTLRGADALHVLQVRGA